jgi:ATP-dependent DNA helicase RecQ
MLRQVLSGVARMSERGADGLLRGRFGRGRIIQMLVGGKSKEVVDAGLDRLSTYGLLKAQGAAVLNPLFAELERRGLIETSAGEFPLVSLTRLGIRVLKTGENVKLRWPGVVQGGAGPGAAAGRGGKKAALPEAAISELGFDEVLFEKLKRHRTAVAQAEGVPAYVIFNNQTLEFLTRLKPRTLEEGRKIRGVGEVKAAQFLPDFVRVIRQHLGE